MTFKWATHSLIANAHNRPHAGYAEILGTNGSRVHISSSTGASQRGFLNSEW